MAMEPMNLLKVLYFDSDASEYSSMLVNGWSDYDLLIANIHMGYRQRVQNLINDGCSFIQINSLDTPALSMVIKRGWMDIALMMLNNGAQIHASERHIDSTLRSAFFMNDLADSTTLVNMMLCKHLSTSKENMIHADGLSAFHIACAKGNLDYTKSFLQGNCINVNGQVSNLATKYAGYCALHFAVEFERMDVVEILLQRGATTYLQDANGSTALHLAFCRQNWQAVHTLLAADRRKKDVANNIGLTHFMIACSISPSYEAFEYLYNALRYQGAIGPSILVTRRVNPAMKNKFCHLSSCTPLHFAALYGRLNIVKMLLSYKADCCALNCDWDTPASLARRNNQHEIYRVLKLHCARLKRLAPINDLNNNSNTNYDSGYSSWDSSFDDSSVEDSE